MIILIVLIIVILYLLRESYKQAPVKIECSFMDRMKNNCKAPIMFGYIGENPDEGTCYLKGPTKMSAIECLVKVRESTGTK